MLSSIQQSYTKKIFLFNDGVYLFDLLTNLIKYKHIMDIASLLAHYEDYQFVELHNILISKMSLLLVTN